MARPMRARLRGRGTAVRRYLRRHFVLSKNAFASETVCRRQSNRCSRARGGCLDRTSRECSSQVYMYSLYNKIEECRWWFESKPLNSGTTAVTSRPRTTTAHRRRVTAHLNVVSLTVIIVLLISTIELFTKMSSPRPKPKLPLLSLELKSQPTLGSGASIAEASRPPRRTSPRLDSSPVGYPDWWGIAGSAELSSVKSSPGKKKHWTAYIPTLCEFARLSMYNTLPRGQIEMLKDRYLNSQSRSYSFSSLTYPSSKSSSTSTSLATSVPPGNSYSTSARRIHSASSA